MADLGCSGSNPSRVQADTPSPPPEITLQHRLPGRAQGPGEAEQSLGRTFPGFRGTFLWNVWVLDRPCHACQVNPLLPSHAVGWVFVPFL